MWEVEWGWRSLGVIEGIGRAWGRVGGGKCFKVDSDNGCLYLNELYK